MCIGRANCISFHLQQAQRIANILHKLVRMEACFHKLLIQQKRKVYQHNLYMLVECPCDSYCIKFQPLHTTKP